jgi:hypothetical protein
VYFLKELYDRRRADQRILLRQVHSTVAAAIRFKGKIIMLRFHPRQLVTIRGAAHSRSQKEKHYQF